MLLTLIIDCFVPAFPSIVPTKAMLLPLAGRKGDGNREGISIILVEIECNRGGSFMATFGTSLRYCVRNGSAATSLPVATSSNASYSQVTKACAQERLHCKQQKPPFGGVKRTISNVAPTPHGNAPRKEHGNVSSAIVCNCH